MEHHDYTIKKLSKIQAGFKRDFEQLLRKYVSYETHSYATFCEIWKGMNFSLIYTGVKNLQEMLKQTELFFFEAKKYFVYAQNIYSKTAVLYLLYGLYYKQPLKDGVKIRLIHSEFKALKDYVSSMKTMGELDVMYVYAKLKHDEAFDYVYTQTPFAPDLRTLANYFTMVDDTYRENVEDTVDMNIKEIIEDENISSVTRDYREALKEYLDSTGQKNIMTFDIDIQKELREIFAYEKMPVKAENLDDIGERRANLKKKATSVHQNT